MLSTSVIEEFRRPEDVSLGLLDKTSQRTLTIANPPSTHLDFGRRSKARRSFLCTKPSKSPRAARQLHHKSRHIMS